MEKDTILLLSFTQTAHSVAKTLLTNGLPVESHTDFLNGDMHPKASLVLNKMFCVCIVLHRSFFSSDVLHPPRQIHTHNQTLQ